jgi:Domain of unknown function (DUF5134)
MTGSAWLSAGLAVVMLVIAVGSAARLLISCLRGRRAERDTDVLHILMGVAMAGMLEPRFSPVPDMAWNTVFAGAAAWFLWQALSVRVRRRASRWNCPNPAPHIVECAAMLYMLLPGRSAVRGPEMAMPGMSGLATANPAVALLLALFMLGYIVWTADQVTARSLVRAPSPAERHAVANSDPHRLLGAPALRPVDGPANLDAVVLAPRLAACYKIVMGIAMGYMLVAML